MQTTRKSHKHCNYKECEKEATTDKFCRLHYIATWQEKRKAKEKKLNQYISAVTKKYPSQYLEVIKKDLSSPESFKKTVDDLDLENVTGDDIFDEADEFLKKLKKE